MARENCGVVCSPARETGTKTVESEVTEERERINGFVHQMRPGYAGTRLRRVSE